MSQIVDKKLPLVMLKGSLSANLNCLTIQGQYTRSLCVYILFRLLQWDCGMLETFNNNGLITMS